MIKKIALLLVALGCSLAVMADEKSNEILTAVASRLDGYKNYEVTFTVSVLDQYNYDGHYYYSNNRYMVVLGDKQYFSDGKLRYEVDDQAQEVIIDNLDTDSSNMLANLVGAINSVAGAFESTYQGVEEMRGVDCSVIELVPNDAERDLFVTIYVSVKSGMPVAITYVSAGESLTVYIKEINQLEAIDRRVFMFDRGAYEGYEIIDFR